MTFKLTQDQIHRIVEALEVDGIEQNDHIESNQKISKQFESCEIIMDDIPKEQRFVYLFIGRRPVTD